MLNNEAVSKYIGESYLSLPLALKIQGNYMTSHVHMRFIEINFITAKKCEICNENLEANL